MEIREGAESQGEEVVVSSFSFAKAVSLGVYVARRNKMQLYMSI